MTLLRPALTIVATTVVAALTASFTGALLLTLPSLFESDTGPSYIFRWLMIGLIVSPFGMILTAPAAFLGSVVAIVYRMRTGKWLSVPLVLALGGVLGSITSIAFGFSPSSGPIDIYFFISFIIVGFIVSYLSFRFMNKAWELFA